MTQEASKAPEAQENKLCKKHEFPKMPNQIGASHCTVSCDKADC